MLKETMQLLKKEFLAVVFAYDKFRPYIADSQVTAVEFEEYKQNADPSDLLRSKKPATESAFQSSGETKPVHIHPTDPDAAPTRISTTLDPK